MLKQGKMYALSHVIGETCAKLAGFTLSFLEKFIPLRVKKYHSMYFGFWQTNPSHNMANFQ
jgi:hypothetical protein